MLRETQMDWYEKEERVQSYNTLNMKLIEERARVRESKRFENKQQVKYCSEGTACINYK